MKRRIFLTLIIFLSAAFSLYAKAKDLPVVNDNNDIAILATNVDSLEPPKVQGNYAIFTADNNARFVGIAFDFENFRTIHSFKLRKITDAEYKTVSSVYFYILELPKNIQTIEYRLIVDGLWTTDPLNTNVVYNEQTGIKLSCLDISRKIVPVTEKKDGLIHFIYKGEKNQQIRLGGSFTNWDSWIYELSEVAPGVYQIDLPLPPGKYEYAFYNGLTSLVDKGNPNRCYTQDGREASFILVN